MGASSAIGAIVGANAQSDAAKKAAASAQMTADQATWAQMYMFDQSLQMQQPYNQLGLAGINEFKGLDPTAGAKNYQTQIENMPALALPELSLDKFNFAFNPNDPTYQYRKGEMEKTIDQAAAARGNYNSRPVINALAEGNMALIADESEKQFGRALDSYNANTSTALSQFGADYGRSTDLYNSGYGKMTDLYNMSMNTGTTDYNNILDAIKIGQGAASSSGAGAMATGQGLANTYGQLGSNLAQSALLKGQSQSDLWSGLGSSLDPGQAYMKYMLFKK